MTGKKFIFSLGENLYALEVERVEEIIKAPKLFKVPLTPEFIAGIATFRGTIIPVIDLYRRLFEKASAVPPKTLVVCNHGREYIGLLVTEQRGIEVLTEQKRKETSEEFIKGLWTEDNREIRLLDIGSLIKIEKAESVAKPTIRKVPRIVSVAKREEKESYLVFTIAGKRFAFPLEAVVEVTEYVEPREVPNPPPGVIGIIGWRKRILPVVDLSVPLGIERYKTKKLVIAQHEGQEIAFQVEDVPGIIRLSKGSIQPPPAYVRKKNHAEVSGTYSSEDEILLILSVDALLKKGILGMVEDIEKVGAVSMEERSGEQEKKFLFFAAGDLVCGLPIEQVVELKKSRDITMIPRSPDFLEGVIEVRSYIVPVLNTGKLFSIEMSERASKLVILEYKNNRLLGLLVDKFLGIFSLREEEVIPLSAGFEGTEITRFVEATTRIGKKVAFLLKPEKLLRTEEIKKIDTRVKKYAKEKDADERNQSIDS
ncbi:chemotaxis protein CheW [Kosmotoga pacifica]|uniref:CheW-like domain-containing protein n=1 Tax=Kosmotoga pacifica TaxID=1330330 RepID=A0A0G2ZEI5_9BACT|nr:chemotaxis protein CheW [Kosmotoga pacifica]AKI97258.1 hypothetical protein IX53_04880 [Kosmotoga pacifica]